MTFPFRSESPRAALVFSLIVIGLVWETRGDPVVAGPRFEIHHSDLTRSISASTGGTDSVTPTISGFITAVVTWDDFTLKPSKFAMENDGVLIWDSHSLSIPVTLKPAGESSVSSQWTFGFYAMMTDLLKATDEASLDPETGDISLDHINGVTQKGEVNLAVKIGLEDIYSRVSFEDEPELLTLSRAPRVWVERTGADLMGQTYDVYLQFDVNIQESDTDTDLNVTMNMSLIGTITFRATVQVSTRFGNWAQENKLYFPSMNLGEISKQGVPIELAYALNLKLRIPPNRRPITWKRMKQGIQWTAHSGRLNEDVVVEMTSDPSTNNWSPVPGEWLLNGPGSLKEGSIMQIHVNLPDSVDPRFIRLRSDLKNLRHALELISEN